MRLKFRRTITHALSLAGLASLLLAAGTVPGNAQGTATWEATYEFDGEDLGKSVVLLDDNTIVAAGETKTDVGIDTDIYVVKTDECNRALWEYAYDIGGNERVGRIRYTPSDGGFIIVGTTQNINPAHCETRDDIFLVKLSSTGTVIWKRVYGGSDVEEGYDVQVADRGYVAAGSTSSYGSGPRDGYLIKTDTLGNRLWSQAYGGSDIDYFTACVASSNGDIAAAGVTYSYGSYPYANILFVRVNQATGNPIPGAMTQFGTNGGDLVRSMVEDVNGDLIMAGSTEEGIGNWRGLLLRTISTGAPSTFNAFDGNSNYRDHFHDLQIHMGTGTYLVIGTFEENANGFGGNDVFMGTADPYLDFTSTRLHGGSLDEQGFGVSGYANNGIEEFVGVGLTRTFGGTPPDLYMIRQSYNGMDNCYNIEPEMTKFTPSFAWEQISVDHFRVGADCEPPMVRRSQEPSEQPICEWCTFREGTIPGSPLSGDADSDPSVSSVDATGSGSGIEMNIYPNPVTSQRMLMLEHKPAGNAIMTLSISDINGKLVSTDRHSAATGRLEIDTEGWAAGTYLVRMTIGGTTESRIVTVLDN